MKITKIICALSILLLLIPLGTSCGDKEKASYSNEIDVKTVADKIESCVQLADGYYTTDSDYLDFYFEGANPLVDSYEIRIANVSTNINQFGVFKVKEGSAEAMKTLCEGYLELKMANWLVQADYIESEHPKMVNSEARVFGNYVIYTILSKDDREVVFAEVEDLLAQK